MDQYHSYANIMISYRSHMSSDAVFCQQSALESKVTLTLLTVRVTPRVRVTLTVLHPPTSCVMQTIPIRQSSSDSPLIIHGLPLHPPTSCVMQTIPIHQSSSDSPSIIHGLPLHPPTLSVRVPCTLIDCCIGTYRQFIVVFFVVDSQRSYIRSRILLRNG